MRRRKRTRRRGMVRQQSSETVFLRFFLSNNKNNNHRAPSSLGASRTSTTTTTTSISNALPIIIPAWRILVVFVLILVFHTAVIIEKPYLDRLGVPKGDCDFHHPHSCSPYHTITTKRTTSQNHRPEDAAAINSSSPPHGGATSTTKATTTTRIHALLRVLQAIRTQKPYQGNGNEPQVGSPGSHQGPNGGEDEHTDKKGWECNGPIVNDHIDAVFVVPATTSGSGHEICHQYKGAECAEEKTKDGHKNDCTAIITVTSTTTSRAAPVV
jgi:hypothetical protein